jgi:hypothetical protein
MVARNGPGWILVRIVFATPFVIVGAVFAYGGLREPQLLQGLFVVMLGALFGGVGAYQIVGALRSGRSPERESLRQRRAPTGRIQVAPTLMLDYRSPPQKAQTAASLYAPVLASSPLPTIVSRTGRHLAVGLRGSSRFAEQGPLAFGLLWTAITLPVCVAVAQRGQYAGAAFIALFVLVGVFMLARAGRGLLARLLLPRVEISAEPVFLGDQLGVRVEQRGPVRIRRVKVDLVCRERVMDAAGASDGTEGTEVLTQSLLDEPGRSVGLREVWSHSFSTTLPASGPHSFAATHTAIIWAVRVRTELAGWPNHDELYELRVLPTVPR